MLLLTHCRTVSVPVRPTPPADAVQLCQNLPDVSHGMTLDDLLRWAGIAVERHNQCMARHKALGDWARGQ
jgi:hypothetical protein